MTEYRYVDTDFHLNGGLVYGNNFIDKRVLDLFRPGGSQAKFTYTFHHHFHPFVAELLERLNKRSIPGLLDPDFHAELERAFFEAVYEPNSDATVAVESFPKRIDLSEDSTAP